MYIAKLSNPNVVQLLHWNIQDIPQLVSDFLLQIGMRPQLKSTKSCWEIAELAENKCQLIPPLSIFSWTCSDLL